MQLEEGNQVKLHAVASETPGVEDGIHRIGSEQGINMLCVFYH